MIKMIIRCRNPRMRHVSRPRSVGLDWLFERIKVKSNFQVKYVNTTQQVADLLTKGYEHWTQLTRLFGLMARRTYSSPTLVLACLEEKCRKH